MRKIDFDNTAWRAGMTCIYLGDSRRIIVAVDFENRFIGLRMDGIDCVCEESDIQWVPCMRVKDVRST